VPQSVESNGGAFSVELVRFPTPPPRNSPFSFEFKLTSRSKAHAAGPPEIEVDARMPNHRHGMMTQPKAKHLEDGRFVVTGMQFHMAGKWLVTIDATWGRFAERAEFWVEAAR
jgi:hypothetical protein